MICWSYLNFDLILLNLMIWREFLFFFFLFSFFFFFCFFVVSFSIFNFFVLIFIYLFIQIMNWEVLQKRLIVSSRREIIVIFIAEILWWIWNVGVCSCAWNRRQIGIWCCGWHCVCLRIRWKGGGVLITVNFDICFPYSA